MTDISNQISLGIAAAFLLVADATAQPWNALGTAPRPSQAAGTPTPTALCLPPGATRPVPCGTARAGQTIRLQVATTSLPTGPIRLMFTEGSAAGQAPRSAEVTIAPTISRDGGYEVTVPREICAAGRDRMGSFQIQRLMSSYNQAETASIPLGTLTVAC